EVDEVPEEIAVVRGELDDAALRPEVELARHPLRVGAGVLEPARRERREVGVVVREDLLAPDGGLELDEEAVLADPDVEGIERLDLGQLVGAQEPLAERRHPEVDEGDAEVVAAQAAGRGHTARIAPRYDFPCVNPKGG